MQEPLNKSINLHMTWGRKNIGVNQAYFLALALAGEVGELANILKKQWRGDKYDENTRRIEIEKELADIGNYLYMLANYYGIDLEQAMLNKMIEVESRKSFKDAMND